MTTVESRISENLARIRAGVDAACRRAGRASSDVLLVGVTKSARLEWIEALVDAGVFDLGESRPQQLLERAQEIRPVRWHLIGHLQRNKVRKILPVVHCLHSIDSLALATRIDGLAAELDLSPRLLLEVNAAGEASKDGFAPDQLAADWTALCALSHVEIAGLMTMAPFSDEPEDSRITFRRLRELRDQLAARPGSVALPELSMGMSGDFEVGIEEGATMIRIGTNLFEGLSAAE
ncbi:MAG TPA: YggS family pyridoxal phosphate-dependent enzyme [Planctomycetaceae bacterium]|jgi:pyridoxal phosphate enzyme (YggS family)|nr:YggS family pyridoxal phosphate-dependent enzyme [Planctomycetaceae bacterium]